MLPWNPGRSADVNSVAAARDYESIAEVSCRACGSTIIGIEWCVINDPAAKPVMPTLTFTANLLTLGLRVWSDFRKLHARRTDRETSSVNWFRTPQHLGDYQPIPPAWSEAKQIIRDNSFGFATPSLCGPHRHLLLSRRRRARWHHHNRRFFRCRHLLACTSNGKSDRCPQRAA
jgi:hypothetical protein